MERGVFSDLLFQPGVLDGALQQTCPRQQDIVAPVFSLAECPGGIGDSGFQIAAIEMEQSRIDVHGADPAGLPVAGVDFEGRSEMGSRQPAQALDLRSPGAGSLDGFFDGVGAPLGRGSIDVLLLPQRDETFHHGDVDQGACQVQMLRIPALIFGDGAVEVLQRSFVACLAPGDAPVGGLYVAAGDEIVGAAEGRFRLLQQPHGVVEFALLERQPRTPTTEASTDFTAWKPANTTSASRRKTLDGPRWTIPRAPVHLRPPCRRSIRV